MKDRQRLTLDLITEVKIGDEKNKILKVNITGGKITQRSDKKNEILEGPKRRCIEMKECRSQR